MVSSEEEADVKAEEAVEWDVEMDIQLFYAMAHHKPVGINKHFQMACIWEKLSNSITKEISTHDIWKHLDTLYDIPMLDDTEPIPFPNHEQLFSLPESDFAALIKQKCIETNTTLSEEPEDVRSPSPKVTTPRSSSRSTASKDSTPKAPATSTVARKDSVSALSTKTRKESGSSHASTDTPSIKSEKDYDRRRDSRDSNASGPRDSSTSRKSTSQREKTKSKVSSVAAWESPIPDEDSGRRGRRRANTSTPPATTPAKRRRT